MSLVFQGVSFLKHLTRSGNQHSIHSPFLFDLYNKVFSNSVFISKKMHKTFASIEKERTRLKADQTQVAITDFGAGSRVSKETKRTVASLTKSGLMSAHWAQSLHRMADALRVESVLELGTSLGITTAYLATVPSVQKLVTLDGCHGSLAVAKGVWQNLNVKNTAGVEGRIEETLPEVLKEFHPQLIVIDANHQYDAVMDIFNTIKPILTENSIVVLDDLYWSDSMARAWQDLQNDDSVYQSLDFFWQGWLFFRQGQAKEHFSLRG